MTQEVFVLGVGRRTITPPLGTPLYGYPNMRAAEAVHDDLHVTAAAVGHGTPSALLINLDLCSVPGPLAERMHGLLSERTGVPKDRIMLSAIHTHSGPCLTTITGWGTADASYIEDTFIPCTLAAAEDAVKNALPARMGIGTVHSDVGINRRQLEIDGTVRLGQNPHALYDPTMTVLAFRTPDGKPIANIVHYGAHATSAGANPEITRDWPGYMVDRLEEISGAVTLFFNGAEGDVGPRLTNGRTVGDITHTEELGRRAAYDAVCAYRTVREFREVDFRAVSDAVSIPYRSFADPAVIRGELEELGDPAKLKGYNLLKYRTLEARLALLASGEKLKTHRVLPQVLFAFNSVVLVPFPYEMFVEITLRLRNYSPFQHTLGICNANGAYAYLPSQDQICRGGYEVDMFQYREVYSLVNNADDHIIRENLRIMQKLL